MQMMELFNQLESVETKDQLSCIVRALRKDERIWSFLSLSKEAQSEKIVSLIIDKKLNPGTLGLLSLNPELVQSGYPECKLKVSVLEDCMVNYETFLQQHNPPVSLEEAAKLAIVLIEKRKITSSWSRTIQEVVNRMHIISSGSLLKIWGTPFAIAVNLIIDKDELLNDLLKLQPVGLGVDLLIHCLLSLPINEDAIVQKLAALTKDQSPELVDKILNQITSINERELAEKTAKVCLDRYSSIEELTIRDVSVLDDPVEALNRSMLLRQIASMAQIAGEKGVAQKLVSKSIEILDATSAGMKIQNLTLVEDPSERSRQAEALKQTCSVQLMNPLFVQEFASAGILPAQNNNSDAHPVVVLQGAKKIKEAGNAELAKLECEKGFGNGEGSQIEKLVTYQPRFNPDWESTEVVTTLLDLGAVNEAVNAAKKMLAKNPASISSNLSAAEAFLRARRYADALPLLEMLSIGELNNLEIERTLAECYKRVGELKASYKIRKQLVNLDQPEIDDLLQFADAAVTTGFSDEVFQATGKVIQQDPDNIQALTINGKAYAATGNLELATDCFIKAIEMGSDQADPWIGLVDLYLNQDEMRKAIETLRNGLSALPGNIEIKRKLAELLMNSGSSAEALPLLNELADSSQDVEIKILQADAMKILGLPEYKEMIDRLYVQYPENLEIAQAHAAELIKDGRHVEAKRVMQDQMEQPMPGNAAVLTYAEAVIGLDFEHSGAPKQVSKLELEKIQEIIDASLTADIENTRAQLLKAELLAHKGLHGQAFEAYSKLLEKQNSIDKSFLERIQAGFATSAAFLGKFETALASIKQAVDSKPEWVGLQKVLAQIYAFAGEVSEALEQANTVLEIGPQIVENILWFVDFVTGLGKTDVAETKLREALTLQPNSFTLRSKLAEVLVKSGKSVEAGEVAAEILPNISADLSDDELVAAAIVFTQTGDVASALTCLENRVAKTASAMTIIDLAGYLYTQTEYGKSLSELEKIDAEADSCWISRCLMADAMIRMDDLASALNLLQNLSEETCGSIFNEPLHFIPERWKELIEAVHPEIKILTEIHFRMGEPDLSRESALKWIDLESTNPLAWIYRLESERALGGNSNEIPELNSNSEQEADETEVFLAAVKAETLLENEQGIEAQKVYEKYSATGNIAIKVIGIRLSVLSGHLADAENTLDEILSSSSDIDAYDPVIQILILRSLIQSCGTLKRWNDALELSNKAVKQYTWHANLSMQYLTVLTRAKEFENVAQLLSLEVHSPTAFLLNVQMDEEIDWIGGLLGSRYENEVERWVLRGKMAASPSEGTIRAFALVTPTPEDAAAMIAALHQNGQDTTAVQVAKKFPNNVDILFEYSLIQSENELDEAIELLTKLISLEPLSPAAVALRSTLYQKTGKLDLAINDLEQAISDWPNETNWRLTAAELWQRYGNNPNAVKQLQAAYDQKADDTKIALALSKSSLAAGELDRAVEILQPLTEKNPNLYEAWEVLSDTYAQRDEMDQALEAAKKASEINPFSTKPHLMSGKIHLEHGNLDKALDQAKQAVMQNKKDADAILFLAKVLHLQGEKRQALAALEMTNQCENVTVQTMVEHVNLMKEINGGASAKELISSLTEKYPENVDLLKLLATVQVENGETGDAEMTVKRALQVDPDEPDLHLFLGKINAETGQLDQAIHHLSQGITQRADQMDGYLTLSKVYEQQREFTKALDILKQAMEIAPTDTRCYIAAANLYRDSKDYSAAEKVLQKAVEIDPKDVTIRRQLGALLALKLVHHSQEASSQS